MTAREIPSATHYQILPILQLQVALEPQIWLGMFGHTMSWRLDGWAKDAKKHLSKSPSGPRLQNSNSNHIVVYPVWMHFIL